MVGQSIEASEAGRTLNEAIAAYRQALKLSSMITEFSSPRQLH
jgi:hypothetical protein